MKAFIICSLRLSRYFGARYLLKWQTWSTVNCLPSNRTLIRSQADSKVSWFALTRQRSSSTERQCWKCGRTIFAMEFFCECGVLQTVASHWTYFDVMGLDRPTFDVDANKLSQRMIQLQKILHPDTFATKSVEEQALAAECSSLVNNAFNTLSRPLLRAVYLLELQGYSVEESQSEAEPSFLQEMMELNEELEEAIQEDGEEGKLLEVEQCVLSGVDMLMDELAEKLRKELWTDALKLLHRINYYESVRTKLMNWKHDRL